MTGYILLGVIAVLAIFLIKIFNRLVALRNRFKNAFAQIDVQLKRRYDLIPNLVETAKGYLKHERETLEAVIAARNAAANGLAAMAADPQNAQLMAQFANSEGLLGAAMGKLNVAIEDYPDLKASTNMQQVSEELTSTENRIAFARQHYNDAVMQYNEYKQSFPANIVAGPFGHAADANLLEFEDKAAIDQTPKLDF